VWIPFREFGPQTVGGVSGDVETAQQGGPRQAVVETRREFFMLIGTDLVPGIKTWWADGVPDYAERVWNEVPFLVYMRPGYEEIAEMPQKARLITAPEGFSLVESSCSSSEVRRRLRKRNGQDNVQPAEAPAVENGRVDSTRAVLPTRFDRDLSCIAGLLPAPVLAHIAREALYMDI